MPSQEKKDLVGSRWACRRRRRAVSSCKKGVVEYGTHNMLMSNNGLYAGMYKKQSNPYVGENA